MAADSVTWDAWRGDDDRWTVRLSYLGGGRARVATWVFDPRGRVLAPADDEARWLVDDTGADRVADDQPAAVRRLAAVPRAAGERAGRAGLPRRPGLRPGGRRGARAEPVRQAASASRGRRQPVPSWDDIMFGPRKRD